MWNTEHILNNNYELGICVICDKNKKLVSNRFYVTFFDLMIAGSSSCGASNYNTENVFYKTIYLNWYYTCIYRTKVFVYMKTLAYLLNCSFCTAYPTCVFLKNSLDNFLTLDEDLFSHLTVAHAQFSVSIGEEDL